MTEAVRTISVVVLACQALAVGACSNEAGYELTFMSDRDGRMALYSMHLNEQADSARVEPIYLTSGGEYAPIWNRQGTELMFTSDESGSQNIWIWDADADSVDRLLPDTIMQSSGDFSPDGRTAAVVFQVADYTTNEIHLLDRETGATEQVTNNELYDVTPRFSPDGSQMAFCRQHVETTDEGEVRNGDIFIMDLADRNVRQLTTGPAFDCLPSWSPDGSRIAFHGCSADGCFIHAADVETGEVKTLAGEGEPSQWPRWSPDGAWIAYTATRNDQTDIMIVAADGRIPRAVTSWEGRDEVADWRPRRK